MGDEVGIKWTRRSLRQAYKDMGVLAPVTGGAAPGCLACGTYCCQS
jgi:hypothetical protein